MTPSNRRYHIEMLLNTLSKPNKTADTRQYLDYDATEKAILLRLLSYELARITLKDPELMYQYNTSANIDYKSLKTKAPWIEE